MGLSGAGRMSPRSKMGAKWLSKVKKGGQVTKPVSLVHLSPLGSQLSFNNTTRIETVCDWDAIRKKYLILTGNEPDKDSDKDEKDSENDKEDENQPNNNNNTTTNPA